MKVNFLAELGKRLRGETKPEPKETEFTPLSLNLIQKYYEGKVKKLDKVAGSRRNRNKPYAEIQRSTVILLSTIEHLRELALLKSQNLK